MRQQKIRIGTLEVNQQDMLLFELENVRKEQAYLQQDVKMCRDVLEEAKNKFEIYRRQDNNSKAFGQSVRSKIDSIFYDHGINKSGAFVGDIDGYK